MPSNRVNKSVANAVKKAFISVNKNGKYLDNLSRSHPNVFCMLVAKCIPQAVAVDVKHTIVNLNEALAEAHQRAEQLENERRTLLDVTPDKTRISRKLLKSKQ